MTAADAFDTFWNKISKTCYIECTLRLVTLAGAVEYETSIEEFYIQTLCGYEVLIFTDYEMRDLNTILSFKKSFEMLLNKKKIIFNTMDKRKYIFSFSE